MLTVVESVQMRSRQTPRGSMAQSEASSDDEDALSPKPKTPAEEKGLEDMIQTELRGKEDTAGGSSSGEGQFNTPRIVKTGV